MTAPVVHEKLEDLEQVSPTRWRSLCSCGFRSSPGYEGFVHKAWESHVRSVSRTAPRRVA